MQRISVLSREYVLAPVSATVAGVPIDPTADVVSMAILAEGVDPVDADFHTAAWEVAGSIYMVRLLVGPPGGPIFAAGTYNLLVRIVDNPEIPTLPAGKVSFFVLANDPNLLATLSDVHRVLGDTGAPDTTFDADYVAYLHTASEWLRRHTGRDWTTSTGPFTEQFDNVRADDFIDLAHEGGTPTAILAYPVIGGIGIPLAPPEGYTLSPGVSYQMDGDRIQLMWNDIGSPFEGAISYVPPMHYQRVVVTYTTLGLVPAPIRDGCAFLAVALKTAGPRLASGVLSEQNEDYRYQLATQVAMADPVIRGLIRDYRKRRVLVV